MSTTWKALIAVALVVPLAAYVVGALVPSTADDGRNRPVIIGERDDEPATPPPSDTRTPDQEPTAKPGRTDDDDDVDDVDDRDDRDDRDDGEDDDDDSSEGGVEQGGSGERGDQTDDGRRPAGDGRDDRDADDRTNDRDSSDETNDESDDGDD